MIKYLEILSLLMLIHSSCTKKDAFGECNNTESEYHGENGKMDDHLTTNNYVRDIVNHPAFKGFGELLLPLDNNAGSYDTKLSDIGSLMPYHSHVDPDIVIGAINYLIDEVNNNKTICYDFYTEQQKQQDPDKRYTGLFFFRGNADAPFAIVCPGGGFSYVGSLHEGFPIAREISKKGFNAFVIRYRLGSEQKATKTLQQHWNLFTKMQKFWEWTLRHIPYGEDLPVQEWLAILH